MKKRLLTLVMALAMCLLLLPGVAQAAEQSETIWYNKYNTAASARFQLSACGHDNNGWYCGDLNDPKNDSPLTIKVKEGKDLIIKKIEATLVYGDWDYAIVPIGVRSTQRVYYANAGSHSDSLNVSIDQIYSKQVSVGVKDNRFGTIALKNIKIYYKVGPMVAITYKDEGNVSFTGTHDPGYPSFHIVKEATTLKGASKDCHIFGGWFTTPDCTGSPVTSLGANKYNKDITLYAKWSVNHTDANNDYICDSCKAELLDKAKADVAKAIDDAVGEDAAEAVTAFADTAKGIVNNATTVNAVLTNKEMALAAIAALKANATALTQAQADLDAKDKKLEDAQANLDAKDKELKEKDKALNAAQADLVVKNYTLSQVGNDLIRTQTALTEKTAELATKDAELTKAKEEIATLKQQIADLEAKLKDISGEMTMDEIMAAMGDNAYATEDGGGVVLTADGIQFPSGDVVKFTEGELTYDANEGVYVFTRTKNGTIFFTIENGVVTKIESVNFRVAKNNGVFTLAKEEEPVGEMTIEDILDAMGDNAYTNGDKQVVATANGIKFPSNNIVSITEGELTYDAEEGVYVFTRTTNGTIKFTVEDGDVTKVESIGFKTAKNNGVFVK